MGVLVYASQDFCALGTTRVQKTRRLQSRSWTCSKLRQLYRETRVVVTMMTSEDSQVDLCCLSCRCAALYSQHWGQCKGVVSRTIRWGTQQRFTSQIDSPLQNQRRVSKHRK